MDFALHLETQQPPALTFSFQSPLFELLDGKRNSAARSPD
jgi:hypothetical protein